MGEVRVVLRTPMSVSSGISLASRGGPSSRSRGQFERRDNNPLRVEYVVGEAIGYGIIDTAGVEFFPVSEAIRTREFEVDGMEGIYTLRRNQSSQESKNVLCWVLDTEIKPKCMEPLFIWS